jgi:small G protein signaling modulator 3
MSEGLPAPTPPMTIEDSRQGASLRAIANATRVMTSDPASILADQGRETGPLIARLALDLIKNARDNDIDFQERPKEKKELAEKVGPLATLSGPMGIDAAMTLNRALTGRNVNSRVPKAKTAAFIPPLVSPLFGSFLSPQSKKLPNAVDGQQKLPGSVSEPGSSSLPTLVTGKPASVPLESIIPATSKPPTQYLSRMYTPLTSRHFQFTIPLPNSASRFTIYYDDENRQPLTDRYGFMYDVSQYDVLLLIRAKECGNTAPACLTGIKIADRREDNSWPEDEVNDDYEEMVIVKGKCDCGGEIDKIETFATPTLQNFTAAELDSAGSKPSQPSHAASRSSSKSRKRSSVLKFPPLSVLAINASSPRHVCAKTIRRLLDQLTEIHDQRQATQRKEWNIFVKQRSKTKLPKTNGPPTSSTSLSTNGAAAAAILGLGTACEEEELSHSEGLIGFAQLGLSANRDERKEIDRLIRSGIPLIYRSKVWLECSGGLEMREPGLFRELLTARDHIDHSQESVFTEIEKDVGRTMPLNIFFGGDGAGVDKLRRVLRAYSRCAVSEFVVIGITKHLLFMQPQSCRGILSGDEPYNFHPSFGPCRRGRSVLDTYCHCGADTS